MAEITGVAFKEGGKVYYFAPGKDEYEKGMGVIVETARGIEYATVVIPRSEVGDDKIVSPLKPVLRKATERDEENHRRCTERKAGAMDEVREKIAAHELDMKLIDCEFAFDGSKAVFYYTAPKRVDFRELVKDLSSHFRMRIELRQVGLRDEIQMLGGLAPCGRECCCASCMPELKKVSIKMAKNQGLSLNPTKISGLCGRLMCCLSYENDYYQAACKRMPKMGSEVGTPDGKGTVVNTNMLKMEVRVKIEDKTKDLVTYKDFPVKDLRFKRISADEEDEDLPEDTEEETPPEAEAAQPAEKPAEKREKFTGERPNGGKPREQKRKRPEGNGENPQRPQRRERPAATEKTIAPEKLQTVDNAAQTGQPNQQNQPKKNKKFHGKKKPKV